MRKVLTLITVALVAAGLASCSSDSKDLLKTVPGDADFVITLNAQKLIEQAGCTLTDKGLQLPEELEQFQDQIPDELNDVICSVNLESAALFGYVKNGEPVLYVIGQVTDEKKLGNLLEEDLDAEKEDGYTVYSKRNRETVAIKDGRIYLCTKGKNIVDEIEDIKDQAKDESILDVDGMADALLNDKVMNVAVKGKSLAKLMSLSGGEFAAIAALAGNVLKDKYIIYQGDLKDKEGSMTCYLMDENGKRAEIPYLEKIDSDALAYIPEGFNFGSAAGVSEKLGQKVADLLDGFSGFMSSSDRQMATMVAEYLKDLDGTTLVAFDINPVDFIYGNPKIDDVKALIMIGLKEGKAEKYLGDIYDLLTKIGFEAEKSGNEIQLTVKLDSENTLNATIKAEGNYLIAANCPIKKSGDNRYAKMLDGKLGGSFYVLPTLEGLTDGQIKYGIEAVGYFEKDFGYSSIKLTNCDKTVAGAIYEIATAAQQTYDKKYPRYNYYEPDFDDVIYEEEVVEVDTIEAY